MLTSASSPPSDSATLFNVACAASSSPRSTPPKMTAAPREAFAAGASARSIAATRAPAASSALTVATPSAPNPPVTATRLPCRFIGCLRFGSESISRAAPRPEQSAIAQVVDDQQRGRFGVVLFGADVQLRRLRNFVRRIDAGEVLELAAACLLVEALRIALPRRSRAACRRRSRRTRDRRPCCARDAARSGTAR